MQEWKQYSLEKTMATNFPVKKYEPKGACAKEWVCTTKIFDCMKPKQRKIQGLTKKHLAVYSSRNVGSEIAI